MAAQLASSHNWRSRLIQTENFDLLSYSEVTSPQGSLLTVYIEGDGLAWLSTSTISNDPTPVNPVGLRLALMHPKGSAVYLARPCQYVGGVGARNCSRRYWTNGRFSEEIILSISEALNTLKAEFGASKLQLVGFSGGGAIAALLAARRDDVIKLITVAGNLDHQVWTTHHKISPLSGSLNPADYMQQLSLVNQVHFVGENDGIIPPFMVHDFVEGLSKRTRAELIVVPRQTHECCWENVFPQFEQVME